MNVSSFPAATIMLTRALIESCLLFQIESKGMVKQLRTRCQDGICSLEDVIKFAITNADKLFADKSITGPLRYLQGKGGHRKFMNDVVHGNWVDPAPSHVEAIAGDVREILRAILNGTA